MKVRFSHQDVLRFAEWSGDRNPLHVDPDYAQATHFGRPVVHGILSVLESMERAGTALSAIRQLDIEFRGAVFPDRDYRVTAVSHADGFTLTAEGDGPVLIVRGSSRPADEPAGRDLAWIATPVTLDATSPLLEPIERSIADLRRGIEFTGFYSAADVPTPPSGPLTGTQARILALCSYVIGMRLPGRRSLFTRATLRFESEATPASGPLRYRAASRRFDQNFRLLDVDVDVVNADGVLVATAQLRSYVPFTPVQTNIPELAEWLSPETRELRGKVAWVIGGTRGLGADLTAALALAGCKVYPSGRRSTDGSDPLWQSLTDMGAEVEVIFGDASSPEWCRQTSQMLLTRHGHIDLLILNACAPPSALPLTAASEDSFSRYVSENVRLVRAPLAEWTSGLEHQSGTVVYVSSTAVNHAPNGWAHYAAVKQTGESLVRAAQQEHSHLRAIIARPGALQTTWSDTPARAVGAIPAGWAAAHIVNALAQSDASDSCRILEEFPPLLAAAPQAPDAFKVVVSASFTVDPLTDGLRFWLDELAIPAQVQTAPYGQTLQTLLDPASEFSTNSRGTNVILLRLHDWLRELPDDQTASPQLVESHLRETLHEFERALRTHRSRAKVETLLVMCPTFEQAHPVVSQLEGELVETVRSVPGLRVVNAADWSEQYGVDANLAADPLRAKLGHIPYTDTYYGTLATIIVRALYQRLSQARKVVVVDCDNTLWQGVVGEVGPEGIAFGPAHRALHQTLVRLSASGILVALCSKNEEADVWRVFAERDDLGLKRDRIVAATINWQAKSENLRLLASRLNLGLDSFVLIDDNPVECAEVRARCPEVLTLEWPLDSERAQLLLRHVWELDVTGGTAEDDRRTQLYREEFNRQELRTDALSFGEFINNLNLQVEFATVSADDLRRASQLTLRTNQFNFTTRRRDESEMQTLVADSRYTARTVKVRDRFGDYGLVGLFIAERVGQHLIADTFLLSCRVLGRGVEHRMAAEFGRLAADEGALEVRLRVETTKRNTPARKFLESLADRATVQADDMSLECRFEPAVLSSLEFDPSDETLEVTEEPEAKQVAATISGDGLRARERQIVRAAFELASPAALHAAIHGNATPQPSPTVGQAADAATAVHQAFASALGISGDRVQAIDRLDALGCDSMKIVEITVNLLERYPSIPNTLLFEHRSVSAIVREINKLTSADPEPIAVAARAATTSALETGALDIAVVGMHVRCAGANSPEELWSLLSEGRSSVLPVPTDREVFLRPLVDDRPHWAGLLDEVATFDPEFFGISPREAEVMDPQLRLFLEVAWSALEDAGYAGQDLEPDTGVFVGVMYGDYGVQANEVTRRTGSSYRSWEGFSLANRLSQVLGLRGPSLAIDTACSSSGTALHVACRALKAGDCKAAVVGGVNLILDPDRFGSLGRLGILSATGTCLPFGADADGTVLGEGAGVVVLRPLQEALRRGDRIYGVIKGSGLSTGHGTVGFTAPNPQAQAEAVARALRTAAIDPRTISYVETHGTGTALGDPIEVRGLTLAFEEVGSVDPELQVKTRCGIGSIKPSIGHLEAGAGVVSLIKVLLQLHRRTLLPSITSDRPNPQIPFSGGRFEVQRRLTRWEPPVGRRAGIETVLPRRAGLSSFGVGGANAHFILEEAPQKGQDVSIDRPAHILTLSARNDRALRQKASDLETWMHRHSGLSLADACHTSNAGRAHFDHRAAVIATTADEAAASLKELAAGTASATARKGEAAQPCAQRLAFLFTGQGAQYAGMGRELYATQPVFRDAIDSCAAILDKVLPEPLLSVLFAMPGTPAAALIDQTGYTQPALFTFQYALAQLWKSWGITPSVVMGHSVGEFAAMCVAGGMSLEDGAKLVAARGRLMQALPEGGVMTSAMTTEERAREAIRAVEHQVAIAAINGPQHVVISGAAAAVADVVMSLDQSGIRTKSLTVSHAFHSPLMEPMLADYEAVVRQISFKRPHTPFVSSVTGAVVTDEASRPDYWVQQVMQPVRFTATIDSIARDGVAAWLEIGPQPVLLGMARHCVPDSDALWLASSRRDGDSWRTLLDSAAQLYTAGFAIDWRGFDAPYARTRVSVPAYPFTRKRYWVPDSSSLPQETSGAQAVGSGAAAKGDPKIYEVAWSKQDRRVLPPAPDRKHWLIFADAGGVAERLAERLRGQGHSYVLLTRSETTGFTSESRYSVNPAAAAELDSLLRDQTHKEGSCVAYLWGMDSLALSESQKQEADTSVGLVDALQVMQALGRIAPSVPAWIITSGAASVRPSDPISPAQTALWGFARTVAVEQPGNWGGVLDLSGLTPLDDEIFAVATEIIAPGDEDQIAFRGDERYVARLVEQAGTMHTSQRFQASNGTYLVTGGLGALGLYAAKWLAFRGARHLVLAGRTAREDGGTREAIEAIRRLGASVTVATLDVANSDDVRALVERINGGGAPLRGVIHAAGVDLVRPIADTTPEQVRSVVAAKMAGARNLHASTEGLDLFVCFSSISAVLGTSGRAGYAAANAFLDGLAHERRRLGLAAVSVNWGPWAGGGMASADQLAQLSRIGNHPLDAQLALKALDRVLQSGVRQASVADVEWDTFRPTYEARRSRPILHALGQEATASASGGVSDGQASLDLVTVLRQEAAHTLGYDKAEDVALDRRFSDMGMDSLLVADYAGRLRKRLGSIPAGAIFNHPTVRALAAHLEPGLAATTPAATPTPTAMMSSPSGMGGYSVDVEDEILAFQLEAFPQRATDLVPARWRWMFLESARRLGVDPLFWVYRSEGRIVGQMGSIPVRLKIGDQERVTGWLVDTMVLEEHRSEAVGSRLMAQAHDDAPFSLSLGQSAQMREIQAHLGWLNVAPLQVLQSLVRPEAVLKNKMPAAAATVAGMALRASSAAKDLFRRQATTSWRAIPRFDERHDALWAEMSRDVVCSVVRDASYLNWKYVDQPGQTFLRVDIEGAAGLLLGTAVWMMREPDDIYGYRRAHLVDVIAPLSQLERLEMVVRSACEVAADAGADSLIAMTTDIRVTRALSRAGFLQREPGRYLLVDPGPLEGNSLEHLSGSGNWFITQGDSDIDRPW